MGGCIWESVDCCGPIVLQEWLENSRIHEGQDSYGFKEGIKTGICKTEFIG